MKKPESIKNLKSITVNSSKEAWNKVRELWNAELAVDLYATKRAGYTIYRSFDRESGRIDYEGGYISCLGTSIELNFEDGDDYSESFRIWIDQVAVLTKELEYANAIIKYEAAEADKTAKRIAELEAENEALRKCIARLTAEANH